MHGLNEKKENLPKTKNRYTFVDSTLERYAPYVVKVETIGDAYMIVSAARTSAHARVLASVALAFLANIAAAVPKLDNPHAPVPTHVRVWRALLACKCRDTVCLATR